MSKLDDVATLDAEGWQKLDQRTVKVTALFMLGFAIAAAVPTVIGIVQGGTSLLLVAVFVVPGAVLLVGGAALLDYLRWRYTRYRVTEDRVESHFSFVFRVHKSIPRDRIRSVDINANPLHRLFGLAKVKVGTGQQEQSGEVLTFDPVTAQVADALRRELLRRGAGERGEAVDSERPIAELRWSWLRYAPISVSTPIIGAAAFGGIMQVAKWFNAEGAVLGAARGFFAELPLLTFIGLLVVVGLLVGVVGSLGLFVELWSNYRLTRETGTVVMRRGLLTTRSLTIEESRLRGIEVVEPLGARGQGAARLDAVASGLKVKDKDGNTQPRILLPVVPREYAHRVAAEILREPVAPTEAVRLTGHPKAARRRRLVWGTASVLVLASVLAFLGYLLTDVLVHLAWISVVVLLPIAIALALDAYRNLGHGITGAYLVTRHGPGSRRTIALRRDGVIGWTITSTPFQRRAGLLTLTATTAANAGAYSVYDVSTEGGLALAEQAVPGLLTPFLEEART